MAQAGFIIFAEYVKRGSVDQPEFVLLVVFLFRESVKVIISCHRRTADF